MLDQFKHRIHTFDYQLSSSHINTIVVDEDAIEAPVPVIDKNEEKYRCKLHSVLHCESCKDTFTLNETEESQELEEGWLSHQLTFQKTGAERDSRVDPNSLVVIDPRERMSTVQQLPKHKYIKRD
jgi:hypothetical protein